MPDVILRKSYAFREPEEDVPQNCCKAPSHALRHALWDFGRVGQDAPHKAAFQ